MKTARIRRVLSAALLGALVLPATAPASAQETEEPKKIDPHDDPLLRELSRAADPQQEMQELFRKVELRLREIDDLLNDASAGDTAALEGVGEAGIDQLLRRSSERGKQVVEDIDRILEIAAQNGGT